MSVLADTSVWVEYLLTARSGKAARLDELLANGEVVMCGPVAAELLAGTTERQRAALWQLLAGLSWSDIGRRAWRRVGEVAAALRDRGGSVPLTDLEIAVAAVEAGASLWTRDRDFDRIAAALPELRRFRAP